MMIRFSYLLLLIGLMAIQMPAIADPGEKEVKTTISEVTLFLKGAQVFSQQTIDLPRGETHIRFTGLSPYILAQSVQVHTSGPLTVLSVNHQQNYLNKPEKSPELLTLENQLKAVDEKITLEQTHLFVLKEEVAFLNENRQISGTPQQVSATALQQLLEFYSNRLTAAKLKEIERNEALLKLNEQRQALQSQIDLLTGPQNTPSGEVVVRVDVQAAGSFPFALSYLTQNAGWYPSYDVRAKSLSEPVQLVYKANIQQDTKMDWTNVKLTLSTANPNASGVAPALQPYFLRERAVQQALAGKVAGIGVTLDEVAMVRPANAQASLRESNSLALPTDRVAQQTSVEFQINRPYTILSDNKNYTVDIESHKLATQYHYLSIPKVDKDAFLIAEVADWEQYNLLDGEANLFFEGTYVGKTTLNVSGSSDTLRLSLGRDRNVAVRREKVRDFNRRQFIGSRQEEARSWKISVRNNKAQAIDLIMLDQVPVSTQSDIEVVIQNISRGAVNTETGEVRWELRLDPAQERSFDLQYQVRYPKNKTLVIE